MTNRLGRVGLALGAGLVGLLAGSASVNGHEFPELVKNGFKKGDIVVVWGRFEPKIGDIIIFTPNPESVAPRPIVHRIVDLDPLQTKGDHNEQQLSISNNLYKTDETNIHESQIIGKVVFKIPYLGWFKIWVTDFINLLF